jgi:NitT/TauT family transport system permease protein
MAARRYLPSPLREKVARCHNDMEATMTALQTRLFPTAGALILISLAASFLFDTTNPLVWWLRFGLFLAALLFALRAALDGEANPRGEKKATVRDKAGPVLLITAIIIVVWYLAAIALNAPFQRDQDKRDGVTSTTSEFVMKTWSQPKPTMPAPHQVAEALYKGVFTVKLTSARSLVYHSWVTLSSTLLGFAMGTGLGVLIAVGIVHVPALDKSFLPWIIASQTIPILAVAPMIVVVLAAVNITGILPKALISAYLSFFPVAVGMVKGLRSPEVMHLDLVHTYSATRWQTFWKLRVPASIPFFFTSIKVAVAASLVGAIVGELPTGAVAGIGSKLLAGSYYSQTIDVWAALIAGSIVAVLLVVVVDLASKLVAKSMGARPE